MGTQDLSIAIRARQPAPQVDGATADEQIFRQAVEDSNSLVVITDATGIVGYVNPQFSSVTGYTPEEIIGRRIHQFGELPTDQQAEMWATVSSGRQWRGEFLATKKDGSSYWVLSSISPMRSAAGRVTHFLSVNLDISERKEAEEAMRRSEERYRALYRDNPTMYFTVDPAGTVLSVNPYGAEQLGYRVEELVGAPVLSVFHPDDQAAVSNQLKESLTRPGEIAHWEFRKVRKDGEIITVKEAARTTRDADGNAIVLIVCEDITEHKRAQAALQESEERYRALYQDNPTMYFTVCDQGTVLSVNNFGAQQLGYTAEELIGRPVLDVFYEQDKKAVTKQMQKCLKSGGRVAHWEFRKVRKTGEVIWVKEAARATRDTDGRTIVLVVCEDITEHKLMEQALERTREELESKVERQIQLGSSYGLTFRELTVLHLVAAGKADKEIGTSLGISSLTVNKHVANIRRKMGASSRTEAGVRALKESLVI